jgi:hypothetical protein
VHFAVFGRINQVKHGRKRAAQIYAAAAAMTKIKHAFHFSVQLTFVVKVWICPVKGMTGRRVEVTFAI